MEEKCSSLRKQIAAVLNQARQNGLSYDPSFYDRRKAGVLHWLLKFYCFLISVPFQISKPVADAVLRYGKDHPIFRNKILIPIGRGLVRMTTRLRMKRLGLGEPTAVVQVSEAAALEQASDFVQQLVLFMYSLGVFSGYYFYTKVTTPETVKTYEFEEFRGETDKVISELRLRVELMESALKKAGVKVMAPPPPPQPAPDSAPVPNTNTPQQDSSQKTSSRFPRVSSLPVDAASNVVLKGEARKSM
ncbi:hypothetical protein ANCCAN_21278 [Ancylostoma caninum]|uniref:Optic atrophy 3 protein n=1 Tax=Ancylostoma caninum TaxID=29170 RepID=A0A368FL00_ANCCA|nr:hypothetical protein ANCCAN_21278 [Ancylostoma caninum]